MIFPARSQSGMKAALHIGAPLWKKNSEELLLFRITNGAPVTFVIGRQTKRWGFTLLAYTRPCCWRETAIEYWGYWILNWYWKYQYQNQYWIGIEKVLVLDILRWMAAMVLHLVWWSKWQYFDFCKHAESCERKDLQSIFTYVMISEDK